MTKLYQFLDADGKIIYLDLEMIESVSLFEEETYIVRTRTGNNWVVSKETGKAIVEAAQHS